LSIGENPGVFLEPRTFSGARLTPNQKVGYHRWKQRGHPTGGLNALNPGLTPGEPIGPVPVQIDWWRAPQWLCARAWPPTPARHGRTRLSRWALRSVLAMALPGQIMEEALGWLGFNKALSRGDGLLEINPFEG
jgi:hypothetical protein